MVTETYFITVFTIDLSYQYGGHIEFIRVKEYYGMSTGHSLSFYARFSGKKELHCISLRRKAILITSKHGTTIFFPPLKSFSTKT